MKGGGEAAVKGDGSQGREGWRKEGKIVGAKALFCLLLDESKKMSACFYPEAVPLGFYICYFFFPNPFILSYVFPCQPHCAQLIFEVSVKMPPFPRILPSSYRATTLQPYSLIGFVYASGIGENRGL